MLLKVFLLRLFFLQDLQSGKAVVLADCVGAGIALEVLEIKGSSKLKLKGFERIAEEDGSIFRVYDFEGVVALIFDGAEAVRHPTDKQLGSCRKI